LWEEIIALGLRAPASFRLLTAGFSVTEKIEEHRKKRAHYAMFDGDCKGSITTGKKNLAGDRYIPG
jgi:hypothetical protein